MKELYNTILCLVIGYVFGNFSTGYIMSKIYKVDIRKVGSGNVGTTNALRAMGLKGGAITFIGDLVKALIPTLIVKYCMFPGLEGLANGFGSTDYFVLVTGFGVVLGHNFPCWLGFKGGKGIASTGGTMLAFNAPWAGVLFATFIGVIALSGYVSLGSLTAILGVPIIIMILYRGKWVLILLGFLFAIMGYIRHSSNIKRLLTHSENKISIGKKEE